MTTMPLTLTPIPKRMISPGSIPYLSTVTSYHATLVVIGNFMHWIWHAHELKEQEKSPFGKLEKVQRGFHRITEALNIRMWRGWATLESMHFTNHDSYGQFVRPGDGFQRLRQTTTWAAFVTPLLTYTDLAVRVVQGWLSPPLIITALRKKLPSDRRRQFIF